MNNALTDYHNAGELALFQALNSAGNPFLDGLFGVLTNKWFGIAVGLLLAVWLVSTKRWGALRWIFALSLAVFLSDFIGARVLKPFFGRMRPCYALPPESFNQVVGAGNVGSLPSLHASNLFAFAFTARAADRRLTIPAYLIALLVAYSRVYVGVHWVSDIAAGGLWGTLVAWAAVHASGPVETGINNLIDRLRRRSAKPASPETKGS